MLVFSVFLAKERSAARDVGVFWYVGVEGRNPTVACGSSASNNPPRIKSKSRISD